MHPFMVAFVFFVLRCNTRLDTTRSKGSKQSPRTGVVGGIGVVGDTQITKVMALLFKKVTKEIGVIGECSLSSR
jgi:hypothetical protein